MVGRKPTPTTLKVLNGNPGKRAINRREPKPNPTAPQCPTWLDPEAKAEWHRLAPELERMGLLTLVDGMALAGYCQSYARWATIERSLDPASPDQWRQARLALTYLSEMKAFATEFGLTPSSRSRIQITPADVDDLDAILGKP